METDEKREMIVEAMLGWANLIASQVHPVPNDYDAGQRPVWIPVSGPQAGDEMQAMLDDGRVLSLHGRSGDWRLSISRSMQAPIRDYVWKYRDDQHGAVLDLLSWDGDGDPPHAAVKATPHEPIVVGDVRYMTPGEQPVNRGEHD